jgi:hypothetical protein
MDPVTGGPVGTVVRLLGRFHDVVAYSRMEGE